MAITLEVNRKRIQRLMRIAGIEALYPKPNLSRPAPGHEIYPYLLRGVSIERPNQVWSTDITYIPMHGGFLYLVAVMDRYFHFYNHQRPHQALGYRTPAELFPRRSIRMAAFGPPLGQPASPSKDRQKFVQTMGSTSLTRLNQKIKQRNEKVTASPRCKPESEMERCLRTAFGTTDTNAEAVTLPDALTALGRLCLLQYNVDGDHTFTRLPVPNPIQT